MTIKINGVPYQYMKDWCKIRNLKYDNVRQLVYKGHIPSLKLHGRYYLLKSLDVNVIAPVGRPKK